MSNYFTLYCRTCDKAGPFHVNWGNEQIQRYANHIGALAAMGRAYQDAARLTGGVLGIADTGGYEVCHYITVDLLEFAVSHEGHDVAARSEYGNFEDRCSDFYRCPSCDTSHACQRDRGHDGEHGRRSA